MSLLKMAENGKSYLPLPAALAFAQIQNFAFNKQATIEAYHIFPDTQPAPTINKALSKHLRSIDVQLLKYSEQSAILQNRYQLIMNRMALTAYLQQQIVDKHGKEIKTAWLEMLDF